MTGTPGDSVERKFGRIEDRLAVDLWPLTRDEYEMQAARIVLERSLVAQAGATERRVESPEVRQVVDLLHSVLSRLDGLEEQMERTQALVARFSKGDELPEDLRRIETRSFDVSGAGVGLFSPLELADGDAVRVVIHLPGSPASRLKALGRVASVMPSVEDAGERPYRLGVEFTAINEDDRQQLVHYLFQRQRALLRSQQNMQNRPENAPSGSSSSSPRGR